MVFKVDVWTGQKTGFYLDQRDNRQRMAAWSAGKRILNCFSYSGGFSVAAALQGAITVSVDVSEKALELARQNFKLNGISTTGHRFEAADVFDFLQTNKEQFEVVILDPPAFIKKRMQILKGARAYQEVNRLAMARVEANGLMLSCSCSAHLSWDLFQKIVFAAAQQSGRGVQIIGRYGQPAAPNPVTNAEFMATIRKVCRAPFGVPAPRWMLEIGAFILRTETELLTKSRRVVPGKLLADGFAFLHPQLLRAIQHLTSVH